MKEERWRDKIVKEGERFNRRADGQMWNGWRKGERKGEMMLKMNVSTEEDKEIEAH